MPRDPGLEALILEELGTLPGLTEKSMFGGRAWLWNGHLLCGARSDGMLVRLGKGQDGWALALDGVAPLMSGDRPMSGWVRAASQVYADDSLRHRLITAALAFVRGLPAK